MPINPTFTSFLLRNLCPKPFGSVQGGLWCTKVGKMYFVHSLILVHQFRTGILERFYGFCLKILKITAYFIITITPKTDFLAYVVKMV